MEDILEFKIQTNLSAAEQGRSSGATVNVVTKKRNQYHGSALEFIRNDVLDVLNFFSTRRAPPSSRHSAKISSAPAWEAQSRETSFSFSPFAKASGKQQGTTTSVNTVPTEAERAEISAPCGRSTIPPLWSPFGERPAALHVHRLGQTRFRRTGLTRLLCGLIRHIRCPLRPGWSAISSRIQFWDSRQTRVMPARDYALGPHDSLFARFSPAGYANPSPHIRLPQRARRFCSAQSRQFWRFRFGLLPQIAHNAVLALTHGFSPTLLGDFRMGFSRFDMHNLDAEASRADCTGTLLGVLQL